MRSPVLSLESRLSVLHLQQETRADEGCEVTEIEISDHQGRTKRIQHLFYKGWPDKGVPTQTDELTR